MKIKILIIALGLLSINCISQEADYKYLIGASLSYSHDDLTNNRLLSNYFPFDKNYSNTFEFLGEFGYFLTQSSVIGIDIGYFSNSSKQERMITGVPNSDVLNSKSTGISLNPKYKFVKGFSDKIWFYTDFKIKVQYTNHENEVTQLNILTYEYENLSMNGKELMYGLSIAPGVIFKLNNVIGIKLDYSLISVLHSTIKKADDSDIDFDDINAWDYNLNMKLSGFNLGVIFTL